MGKVSTYGYSDIGNRQKNEDNGGIYLYGTNIVAAVTDGLGGQGEGYTASSLALRELSRCGAQESLPGKEEIEEYFRKANEEILKRQQNKFHMKTTAVYLCIHQDMAVWAHIGDSRLYHFYQGKLCHYTLDHSVSQIAVLMGEIRRSEIPGHAERSRLLRALGCEDIKPEIHEPVPLDAGFHVFLLCTDGFWECIGEEELQNSLSHAKTAEEWITMLRQRIASDGGENHDNNTAMAVFLEVSE